MVALLIVGLLGLGAAVLLAWRGQGRPGAGFWWGFVAALLVWAGGLAGLVMSTEQFIGRAQGSPPAGLLVCIVVVAVANAVRREPIATPGSRGPWWSSRWPGSWR